jgi:hypothetical protein
VTLMLTMITKTNLKCCLVVLNRWHGVTLSRLMYCRLRLRCVLRLARFLKATVRMPHAWNDAHV